MYSLMAYWQHLWLFALQRSKTGVFVVPTIWRSGTHPVCWKHLGASSVSTPPAGLVSEGIRAMARGSYAWPLAADVVEHSIYLRHSVIGFNINTKIY